MIKAYKTELNPNNKQVTLFSKAAGIARFTYNWGLEKNLEALKNNEKFSNAIALHKQLNAVKKTDYPWMYDVSKTIPQQALRDLDRAWKNKARGLTRRPKYKSKHKHKQSFYLEGSITVRATHIKLPRIGWVRLKESGYIPINGEILSTRITQRANKWFVSVSFRTPEVEVEQSTGTPIGIDLGVRTLATLNNGTTYKNLKHSQRSEKKLRSLEKEKSRREKGSNRRKTTVTKISKLHYKVACQRQDYLHKVTSSIVARTKPQAQRPSVIAIEDLSIKNMLKNRRLAKHINDASWREFRRQLEYKSKELGITVLCASKFYPSSKTCYSCKTKNPQLKLATIEWKCSVCGVIVERDLNAAKNLYSLAASYAESINGRGGEVRLAKSSDFESICQRSVNQTINV